MLFTNEKLFRFGMADSPSCVFCQTEVESVGYLLFSCRVSSSFWKHVLSWLRDYNISVDSLEEEDVIFIKFDIAEYFLLFNHILLLGKFYIYSRKYQNGIHLFKVLQPGQGVFIISNSILPGKETNQTIFFESGKS